IGAYVLTVIEDCPMAGGKLALVVISHGRGGDFLGHHDTAEALADAGFAAVAINHPGDTARDMSRTDDPLSFSNDRPTSSGRSTSRWACGPTRRGSIRVALAFLVSLAEGIPASSTSAPS